MADAAPLRDSGTQDRKKRTATGQPYEAVNIFFEIYDGLAYN